MYLQVADSDDIGILKLSDEEAGCILTQHKYLWISPQIDTRKASTIRFVASGSYPVITFGPFSSPEAVLTALSKATGTFQESKSCQI